SLSGCSSSVTTNVIVNSLPNPNFTYSPSTPSISTNMTFSPAVSGLNYSWTFQNGTPSSSSAQNPVVTWSAAGTADVTLRVTDGNGCVDTSRQTLSVINCPSGSQ